VTVLAVVLTNVWSGPLSPPSATPEEDHAVRTECLRPNSSLAHKAPWRCAARAFRLGVRVHRTQISAVACAPPFRTSLPSRGGHRRYQVARPGRHDSTDDQPVRAARTRVPAYAQLVRSCPETSLKLSEDAVQFPLAYRRSTDSPGPGQLRTTWRPGTLCVECMSEQVEDRSCSEGPGEDGPTARTAGVGPTESKWRESCDEESALTRSAVRSRSRATT
jgi:hypothetical protein